MKTIRFWSLFFLSLILAACSTGRKADSPDPAFAEFVKAYTGGSVSDGTAIRIELAAPVPMDRQTDGLFSFKPSLAGSERWLSPTVVEFVPDGYQEGKVYEGAFRLDRIMDIPDKAYAVFPFSFQAAPKTAVLALDGVAIHNGARLQGSIRLSVPAAQEDLVLTVAPSVPATLSGEGTLYHFETADIARGDQDIPVTVSLKVNGFQDVVPLRSVIPGSNEFRVIDTRILRGENPVVEIRFSDPLDLSAAREGLVELSGVLRQSLDVKDNCARVFYEGNPGDEITLTVHRGLKSADGKALAEDFQTTFEPADPAPAVEIPLEGNILPDKGSLILPLRAVNLSAVDIKITRIYENNLLLFLQENALGGNYELRRAGRLVYSNQIPLQAENLHEWNNFSVDLTGLFRQEPGAIYRIRLSFRKEYSLYGGKSAPGMRPVLSDGKPSAEEDATWDIQDGWYWENFMDWNEYNWEDSNNPEKPSYYMLSERFPAVNLMSSNLGMTAQFAGTGKLWAAVTDLMDAKPLSGVDLEAYDYQLQRIGTGKTDGKGLAEIPVPRKPFVLVGRTGKTTGFLRLGDGDELSLSRFDVGGQTVSKGLKGFVYGERGVWRPGDTLHVTMILADKQQQLPEGLPAALELYTPEGQFHTRMVSTARDGFYTFPVPTSSTDPTGWWNAYIKVGGSAFHKSLHIETVKPNRLKVNLDLPGTALQGGTRTTARLSSSWLTGVPASGLKAHATMTLGKGSGTFKGFEGYIFRNPASVFEASEHPLFETTLSAGGTAQPSFQLPAAKDAPGLLSAFIVTSVQEGGGDESFTTQTVPYSPFPAYVGVKFPSDGMLETDKDHTVRVAVVDESGTRLPGRKLEYRVYKLQWSWWMENNASDLSNYVNGSVSRPVASGTLVSGTQDATFTLRAAEADWGNYLVIVRDIEGGHLSGKTVTIDWPSYEGRAARKNPEALTMLTFSTDKDSYKAGEKATVYIPVPGAEGGKALVSLENASGVISRQWVAAQRGKDTPFTFTVTPEMAPNFYVHVTLVQPYSTAAGGPLRLLGVKRLRVDNPQTHLQPLIQVPEVVEPEKKFTIRVSEKSGKPMTYTLAVVDEGLLDLTAFKTPSPWDAMYSTEALGVKTWDLYDQVVGAYAGRFRPMLSIGGDQENIRAARKDNRFNPVVRFLGPFTLSKGTASHDIQLPMYVGSLRVMVVAGHDGAYGNADKTVTVKSPLMVLTSLPRRIGDGEKVVLPVNVFALEDGLKEVKVTVKAEGALQVDGDATATVRFDKTGDTVVRFVLRTNGEGPAKVTVAASGAAHKASDVTDIQVVNPNPETVTVRQQMLPAGKGVTWDAAGGSTLGLAGFPAVDASGLYTTMRSYPYDCTEQLSSRGLVLLNLLSLLPEKEAAEARELIPDLVKQLYARQRPDGGFAYWTGSNASDSWASSMAGAFLSGAKAAGFEVQTPVLDNWKRFQKNLSQAFRLSGDAAFSQLDECFRLYSLSVAGDAQTASMNRLKESDQLDSRADWMLAAAYAVSGKARQAQEIVDKGTEGTGNYDGRDFTYGSGLRDKAVVLQVLALTGDLGGAVPVAQEVADKINKGGYSTQEAAFAAMAMASLAAKAGTQTIKADIAGEEIVSAKTVYNRPVSGPVTVKNTADGPLYATMTTVTKAPAGAAVSAAANGLKLTVTYQDHEGKALSTKEIQQGKEFTAVIQVANPTQTDYRSLALSSPVPSGWEILNDRMRGGEQNTDEYRDIRDDRCDWFFDLAHGASRSFNLKLRAAYEGSYILPSVTCSAMYQPQVTAHTASGVTAVTR